MVCLDTINFLQCYSHLTEWTELEAAALVNVDESTPPKLDKLWDDNYFTVSVCITYSAPGHVM